MRRYRESRLAQSVFDRRGMQRSDIPIRDDPRAPRLRPAIANPLPDSRNGAGSNSDVGRSRRRVEPDAERLTVRAYEQDLAISSATPSTETAVRGNRQVRSVVDGLPRRLEIPNARERIGTCQQRPLNRRPLVRRLSLQPGEYRLRTRVEGDDQRSLAAEHLLVPRFRIDGRAAACGNDDLIPSQELFQDGAFAGAECGLSLIPEDGWDGCAPVPLDLHVGVGRRPSQALGKTARDARLARATETDQDDPIDVAHILLETELNLRGRSV